MATIYVKSPTVNYTGTTGNDAFIAYGSYLTSASIAIAGNGGSDVLQVIGSATMVNDSLQGVQTVTMSGTGQETLALGTGNETVNMGVNADNVAIGGFGNTTFNFGAAGQTAIGGTGQNVYSLTAARAAGSTIDGSGLSNRAVVTSAGLVTVGSGNGDLHLHDVQTITLQSSNDQLLINDDNSYVIRAGNGNDLFDLFNGGHRDVLVAGNGNDTVVIGSHAQAVALGAGANTVYVNQHDLTGASIINGGTGAHNTLVVTPGDCDPVCDVGGVITSVTSGSPDCWTTVMGARVIGFATVDLSNYCDDARFIANATSGLTILGSAEGGDWIELGASNQNYDGNASGSDGDNTVLLSTGLAAGTTLASAGNPCTNTLVITQADTGSTYNLAAANVSGFGNVFVEASNVSLTLNGANPYSVQLCLGCLQDVTENITGGATYDSIHVTGGGGGENVLLTNNNDCSVPVYVCVTQFDGSIAGGTGGTTLGFSSNYDITNLSLGNITCIGIGSGATVVMTSAQVEALEAADTSISGGGNLVVDLAAGVQDLNVFNLGLGTNFLNSLTVQANNLGDTIWGGSGNETIIGGTGGSSDNDWINAGSGNDTIIVGTGQNTVVYTGDGDDTVVFGAFGSTATSDVVVGATNGHTTILVDSGTASSQTVHEFFHTYTIPVYSPDVVNFTGAQLLFQSSGSGEIEIDSNAVAILSDTQTQMLHGMDIGVTDAPGGVLEIMASGTYEALTANDGENLASASHPPTFAFTNGFDGNIVLVDNVSGTSHVVVESDVSNNVTDYIGNFVNAASGVVSTDNHTIEHSQISGGQTYSGENANPNTGAFTFNENPTDGATITAGGVTYTFETSADEYSNGIVIGASLSATLTNALAAVSVVSSISGDQLIIRDSNLDDVLSTNVSPSVIIAGEMSGGNGATPATAQFCFNGNPAPGDTVTIDGTTFTFGVGHMSGPNEVQIGSDLSATLCNLLEAANCSSLTGLIFNVNDNQFDITASSAGQEIICLSECTPRSFYATDAGTFTPLAGNVLVNLDGSGNQAAWVGSGVDRVVGGAFSDNSSTDFFVFDVSAENSTGVVKTALEADAAESSFAALAGATYFLTSDQLIGNTRAATPNQIDVLANTDFTNAVATYQANSEAPTYTYGAIGNVNQVYIANGVDATFNSWQVDNSNPLAYSATPSADNLSNIGGDCQPVVIYGADGTAPYFDATTQTWVPAVIAHSYLTVNVTNADFGVDPPALDLTNIYTVAGSFGEIDVTINDTYNGANTIVIVDGSNPTDTAGADLLIVNADAPNQTFLFDNNDGCGWFVPTDTFNGSVFTTMDIENYVSNDYAPSFDKAGVPLSLGASIPGEANFTDATITNMAYFVIGASGDTVVDGTAVATFTGSTAYTAAGEGADNGSYAWGPAVAEFMSPQVDNSSAFVGFESALIVDVHEVASLNTQSGLVQEQWALGANGAIHISVNTNLALYFTDTNGANITYGVPVGDDGNYPFGTEVAIIKADPNFVAQDAVGSFIVGGATYGVGNEELLGSSGVDNIYAGTGTTTNGVTVAGLNTYLDGEGGTGTDAAGHVQVSTDLLQGANVGWATFVFDTVDVTNPSAVNGQGPNTEILMDGTTGFAVTDDTINGTTNSGTAACGSASVFNEIDVQANTDFTGASINLTGGSSNPAIVFIESGVAAVFTDTQLGQFMTDDVIIQDSGPANLVVDMVETGSAPVDLSATFQAVLPGSATDAATGQMTYWNSDDTLTIVTNASGSTLVASDLPGVNSDTLYLEGQGGNDNFVFNNVTSGQDPNTNGVLTTSSYGITDATINGHGGVNTLVIDVPTSATTGNIQAYDFTNANLENIQTIEFTHSDTAGIFNAVELSGTSIALVNNDYGSSASAINFVEVNGTGNIDLSHLNVSQWVGSQSEIIIDDSNTTSVTVYGSQASDEIVVGGYGDSVRGEQGPDLAWFQHANAANNYDYQLSDISSVTGAASNNGLGAVADLIEGFNNSGTGYATATADTISSSAVDPYGYLDIQGFTGLSSAVDTTAVHGVVNVSSLSAYGVIEDTDSLSLSFTTGGSGLGDQVSRPGIQVAVNDIVANISATSGQEFLLVMYDASKTDAAVFLVDAHQTGQLHTADIQVLGVIDHAVAANDLLPSHFFHIHA